MIIQVLEHRKIPTQVVDNLGSRVRSTTLATNIAVQYFVEGDRENLSSASQLYN